MKNIEKTTVYMGRHHFGPLVDITDPCYDRDVWCRINDVRIVEDDYDCQIDILEYDEDFNGLHPEEHDRRVSAIQITRIDRSDESDEWIKYDYTDGKNWSYLGEIGVDAGVAGFFNHKPDYTEDEWARLCLDMHEGEAWFRKEGFFSCSGYGDGCYGVYAYRNLIGEITGLRIEFIEDEEDDDDEPDES